MAGEIKLPIRTLAEFLLRSGSIDSRFSGLNLAAEGSRIHRRLQKQGGKNYTAEKALALSVQEGDILYHLSGRADGIIREADGSVTVDEIKTTPAPLEGIEEQDHPEHWAQAACYAHILCVQEGHAAVTVRLTYCQMDTGEIKRFHRPLTAQQLEELVMDLLRRYRRWARMTLEWHDVRNRSLRALRFPFSGYRAGQRDMAIACYQTFKNGGRLFCCAPTGIGKTVSALFPAMKAMGEGYGERIFYLTAKTITRKAAEGALELLRKGCDGAQPLEFYSLTLTAKDKICFLDERACQPGHCPYADGYYDRANDAVYEVLQSGRVFGREQIEAAARHHRLCPYELSLDLALWCDCVVCDYNYLFDPVVHLQRFFEGKGGDNLFLIDEAHNLVDRSREMYSAGLRKSDFFEFKKQLPKQHTRLHKALYGLNAAFVALRKECEAAGETVLQKDGVPQELEAPLERFVAAAEVFLEAHRGSEHEQALLNLYFEALAYRNVAGAYDDTYTTLVYRYQSEVRVRLFCLDPAPQLEKCLDKGRAAVFFSATLLPLPYYRETLGGGPQAKLLLLGSPFDEKKLGLFVAGGVSTRYNDRAASLPDVAALIAGVAQAKPGNYIAYFPSYRYMQQVYEVFCEKHPAYSTVLQHAGMEEAQREEFLARFEAADEPLLGFCVLGGIFAEGIDLAGESLLGTVVVGVGLPQIGPEPDALRAYYNRKNGYGFEYAYQFPGMNKVLQAVGRVIRTEEDCGVALLVDSRFATPRYEGMFPPHWRHALRLGDAANLPGMLQAFWNGTGNGGPPGG